MQAIEQSNLAKVVNQREVHLISYPTIKISATNELIFKEIEMVLNQTQVLLSSFRSSIALAVDLIISKSI